MTGSPDKNIACRFKRPSSSHVIYPFVKCMLTLSKHVVYVKCRALIVQNADVGVISTRPPDFVTS